MPLLQINTNVEIDDPGKLAEQASKKVAEILGKPESYVMVSVNPGTELWFGGNNKPAAHLKLKSLGLPESETGNYSAVLCEFIEQQLGIPGARTYIEFDAPARHAWGWDKHTF